MNGTNTVGLNGTNKVGMNGTNKVGINGYGDYSTDQVGMNGYGDYSTDQVGMNGYDDYSINGTNSVQLNGTNSVQLNGTDVEDLNPYDIDLDHINGTEEDLDTLRLALMYGDSAAIDAHDSGDLNGLADVLAARKAKLANETPEQAAARKARRAALVGKLVGAVGLVAPGAGGILKTLTGAGAAKAASIAAQTAEALDVAGIDPNAKALAARAAKQADAGLDANVAVPAPTGIAKWWSERSKTERIAVYVGGAAVVGGILYLALRKKKGKKRR
jgi:hypothetical protein